MAKQHIVIVGGGFGGVKTALMLSESPLVDVTLVCDHPDFRYYPSLYRTATGGRKYIASIPLKEIFVDKDVNIVNDSVSKINKVSSELETISGQKIKYNTLVLALGVQTNYFGITGLKEFSYGIKNADEAVRLKRHLHQQMLEDKRPDLNYVVVGGGPTGVELAGALLSYLHNVAKNHGIHGRAIHVSLVEASSRLLPRMPKDMGNMVARHFRKLGIKLYLSQSVKAETADQLMLGDKKLDSHTVIWTAGVTNHPFFAENGFQMTKNNKVRVDQFLQAEPNIYVIGDNADTPYSGMAQTALSDGEYIANNILRTSNNKDKEPYVAKKPIYVFPAGAHWSAVLWGNIRIYGRLGAYLRRLADLIAYHDYEPWQLATKRWLAQGDNEEECIVCSKL